ncbi:MAG TPA: MBL fold metallo-hydrolase [Ideonella sp.]|nr:MBL fold metallo-hydrolase [Ideonella sp.]
MTDFDRDAQGARRAASVIVLRDSAAGPEVLMMRRAERAGDMRSGVWVFPGGVLDPVDATLHALCDGDTAAAANERLGLSAGALDYSVAALRECAEEVGLLFASGEGVAAAVRECSQLRTGDDFAKLCARHGLLLAAGELAYHSHWLTPPGMPQRFDTRFFVARAPAGQVAVADEGEALEIVWFRPAEAVAAERNLKLLPVTRETLKDLARFATVDEALAEARARRHPPRMMPRIGVSAEGAKRPVLPGEWAYAEIGRLDPQGRGDVCFELPPLHPVHLSERVTRITCANGSVMTGPGTNTYLIRAPRAARGGPSPAGDKGLGSSPSSLGRAPFVDDVTVLDPGPDDLRTEAHLQAVLKAAAPGRIVRIVVTHTHKDHSPATARLVELTGARVVGRVASHPEWQDAHFKPDEQPQDGDRIVLGEGATLRAVATPGHASNHLCWLLEEERLLFTGDHVMQGSTVVINPPDGDMATYLASLERLLAFDLQWFAPGHGFLMAAPHDEVRKLVAHRLAREAKVAAALQAAGEASAEALVPTVYGDVPASRHGIAARSLTAHLIKLEQDGRVRRNGGKWRWQED